jgi:preprotein translocase subunit SecE
MQWNPAVWVSDTKQYLVEVRTEFRKVTWPTQKEAVAGTIGVLVVVTLITAALSLVDLLLGQVMRFVVP